MVADAADLALHVQYVVLLDQVIHRPGGRPGARREGAVPDFDQRTPRPPIDGKGRVDARFSSLGKRHGRQRDQCILERVDAGEVDVGLRKRIEANSTGSQRPRAAALPLKNAFTSTDVCCTTRMPMRTFARAKSARAPENRRREPSVELAPHASRPALDAARDAARAVITERPPRAAPLPFARAARTPLFLRSRSTFRTRPASRLLRPSATGGPEQHTPDPALVLRRCARVPHKGRPALDCRRPTKHCLAVPGSGPRNSRRGRRGSVAVVRAARAWNVHFRRLRRAGSRAARRGASRRARGLCRGRGDDTTSCVAVRHAISISPGRARAARGQPMAGKLVRMEDEFDRLRAESISRRVRADMRGARRASKNVHRSMDGIEC